MSHLMMDKFGNVTESDGQGGVRQAQLVADDNVQKLSIQEGDSVTKDRMALQALEKAKRQAAFIKFKQNMAFNKLKAAHVAKQNEKIFQLKKKLMFLQNIKDNSRLSQALAQRQGYNEKLSGVSGFGLTPDGQIPESSTDYFDFNPIVSVSDSLNRFDQDSVFDVENMPPSTAPTAEQAVNQELALDNSIAATQKQIDAEIQTAQAIKTTGMPTQTSDHAEAMKSIAKVGMGLVAFKIFMKVMS